MIIMLIEEILSKTPSHRPGHQEILSHQALQELKDLNENSEDDINLKSRLSIFRSKKILTKMQKVIHE